MESTDALRDLLANTWMVVPLPSIIYHNSGSAVAINSAARRMFRYSWEEVMVLRESYNIRHDQSIIDTGHLATVQAIFADPTQRVMLGPLEYTPRHPDGTISGSNLHLKVDLIPLRVGDSVGEYIAGYYHDVASELTLKEALQAHEQSLDQVQQVQNMLLEEIEARSAPVIPVFNGILVLPLTGAIDSSRAQHIIESTLEQATRRASETLILDITGVPMVDTQVANYLLQAIRSLRLVGTETVLVGIGPEIAQTIVQLGLRLDEIVTRADLQSGLEWALQRQGLAVQPLPGRRGLLKGTAD